jgi:hypothetical protein
VARIAAIPAEVKAERITALSRAIELEPYADNWIAARARIASMQAEIAQLNGDARQAA